MIMTSLRPIASVGFDLPFALLEATGRYAGPLNWNVDREMPVATQWLESKFPLWAFSIVEDWAAGAFDHLEAVVFSRGDDAAQRLYYYLCELRDRKLVGGPEPLIFDVAHITRPSSAERSVEAVRRLASRLGVTVADAELAIANGALVQVEQSTGQRNCLLSGTPPPDRRLHAMIEAAGWTAHGLTLADLWAGRSAQTPETNAGDAFAAIGRAVHAATSGPRSFADRQQALIARVESSKATSAILWFAEEDEAEIWNLPAQQDLLAQRGIPTLVITRASWRCNDGVAGKINAFLGNLETVR